MDTVLRSVAVYLALLILFRMTGRRSLQQLTTFDLVLLLVIGGAAQPALIGDDFSLTTALIAIATLLIMNVLFSILKRDVPIAQRLLEGQPTVLVIRGMPLRDMLRQARVDELDVMQAARERQGIMTMDDIGLAVLEVGGAISIVSREQMDNAMRADRVREG